MPMKLMTKELEEAFAKQGDTSEQENPMVLAKFFHPFCKWTWYAYEYDPEDRIFFGLVDGDALEYGSFALSDFEQTKVHGLPFERDLHWTPKGAKDVFEECLKRRGGSAW